MTNKSLTMVHIYLSEETAHLQQLMKTLHDDEQVKGVTVYRGISGFGDTGEVHSSTLIDLSLNLPIVVEFFDTDDKVNQIIEHIRSQIKPAHIISWPVQIRN